MEKIPEVIHESWHRHLQPLFDDPKMELIKSRLLPSCKFFPEAGKIFRVFSMPLDQIKVVILGQDPYFNGSAIGYAFAVDENSSIPKSLDIILKEVLNPETSEEYVKFKNNNPQWKTLQHWVEQGVFLLNTALTVEIGKAGSHLGQWMWFTREVVKIISLEIHPIWLLWGAKAQSFKEYIGSTNVMLQCPHPAAGAYSGGKTTFEGCNHFNLCNEILKQQNKTIINW